MAWKLLSASLQPPFATRRIDVLVPRLDIRWPPLVLILWLAGCTNGDSSGTGTPARRPTQARGTLIAAGVAMEHYGSCGFVCHCSAFSDGINDILHFGCGGQLGVAECDAQPIVTVPAASALSNTVCDQRVVVCLRGTDSCIEATVMDTGPRNWEGNTRLFNALGISPADGRWAQRGGACLPGEFAGNTGHCCTYGGGATTVDIYQAGPPGPVHAAVACGEVPYQGFACDRNTLRRCDGTLDGVVQWGETACGNSGRQCTLGMTDPQYPSAGCCGPTEDPYHRICLNPIAAQSWMVAVPDRTDGQACERHLECISGVCGCSAQSPTQTVCLAAGTVARRCHGEPCSPVSPPCAGGCGCVPHPQLINLTGTCQAQPSCSWTGVSRQPCTANADCAQWGGRCGCIDGQYRCLPQNAAATDNCGIHARKNQREPCSNGDECKSGLCGGCWTEAGGVINAWKVCLPTTLHGSTAAGACGQPGHRCDPSSFTPQCVSGSCACTNGLDATCC